MTTFFPAFPAPAAKTPAAKGPAMPTRSPSALLPPAANRAPTARAPAAANQTNAATGTNNATGGGIAENFDAFLKLLTTQLQNQSPLDPLNTNEFTQQLVQFASVEQQLKQNATLQSLLVASQAAAASTVASFLGMTIRADGATAPLAGGKATWSVEVPRAASTATMTIRNAEGDVVATRTQTLKAGQNTFTWDGKTTAGAAAPEGDYTLSVVATDVAGQTMKVSTQIEGTVTGADLSGDMPVLLIGTVRVDLGTVRSINKGTP